VRDGDLIELSVDNRSLNLLVDEEELSRRRAAGVATHQVAARGYNHLYQQHCLQANLGADFDFLRHASLQT
jgi:dihydroxyacid dehydratase/phosphogluconate dehydratase